MRFAKRSASALVALLTMLGVLIALPAAPASAGPSVDVKAFGPAPALGAPDAALNGGIVDIAAHPTLNGYWLLGRDGGVFSYGVPFFGSTGGMRLNKPVVGMTPTPDGNGYWFVAEDGGVFSFGSARFFGSTGSMRLNSRIIGMAATPSGGGYWLIGEDGGVFAFGDAPFYGSTGGVWTGTHIVGIVGSGTRCRLHVPRRERHAVLVRRCTALHRGRDAAGRRRRHDRRAPATARGWSGETARSTRTVTPATWAARARVIATRRRSQRPRAAAIGSPWCRGRPRVRRPRRTRAAVAGSSTRTADNECGSSKPTTRTRTRSSSPAAAVCRHRARTASSRSRRCRARTTVSCDCPT